MTQEKIEPPIHVARIQKKGAAVSYLFLRQDPDGYRWYEKRQKENATDITEESLEEALRVAWRTWRKFDCGFRMLRCGYRYTLPERDEHGTPALFHEMVSSYATPMGEYFDELHGYRCIVKNASEEALHLWRELQREAGQLIFPSPKRVQ